MSNETATFDRVADIIAETADIPRDKITPESHAIDDLGIEYADGMLTQMEIKGVADLIGPNIFI